MVFFSLCIQLQTRQCDLQLLPRLHMALARTRGPPTTQPGSSFIFEIFWNTVQILVFEASSRYVGCWLTATDFTDVTLAIEDINCWRWRVMLGIKIEYIQMKIVK